MSIVVVQQSVPTASTASSQGRDAGAILEVLVRECGDRPPDPVLALNWLNDRYRQIWAAAQWPFALKEDFITTVDDITSDSVTVTNASTTVTETTSDSKWTSVVEGRKFRRTGDNQSYEIDGYSNANPDTLTLDHSYEGTTGTAVGYRIYQNVYSLNTEVGQLLSVYSPKDDQSLTEVSQDWLDRVAPHRDSVGVPNWYAVLGRDANDIYRIELYPAPDAAYAIYYRYVQEAPYIVGGEAKLVPQIFQSLLRHGWLADYWRWRQRMDDAVGQEYAFSATEELLFAKELNELVVKEAQNYPPRPIRLASRYTAHRARRLKGFGYWHSETELP